MIKRQAVVLRFQEWPLWHACLRSLSVSLFYMLWLVSLIANVDFCRVSKVAQHVIALPAWRLFAWDLLILVGLVVGQHDKPRPIFRKRWERDGRPNKYLEKSKKPAEDIAVSTMTRDSYVVVKHNGKISSIIWPIIILNKCFYNCFSGKSQTAPFLINNVEY